MKRILYANTFLYVKEYTLEAIHKNKKSHCYSITELTEEMNTDQKKAKIPLELILESFFHPFNKFYSCRENARAAEKRFVDSLNGSGLILECKAIFCLEVEQKINENNILIYEIKKILTVEVPPFQININLNLTPIDLILRVKEESKINHNENSLSQFFIVDENKFEDDYEVFVNKEKTMNTFLCCLPFFNAEKESQRKNRSMINTQVPEPLRKKIFSYL